MANNLTNQGFTWSEIKMLMGFATVLVSIVLTWASLTSKVDLLTQKTDNIIEKATISTARIDIVSAKADDINNRLVRIETIISQAQSRGLLSDAQIKPTTYDAYLAAIPQPSDSSKQEFVAAMEHDTPTPTPTQAPTQTSSQNTASPVSSLLPTVLNLFTGK